MSLIKLDEPEVEIDEEEERLRAALFAKRRVVAEQKQAAVAAVDEAERAAQRAIDLDVEITEAPTVALNDLSLPAEGRTRAKRKGAASGKGNGKGRPPAGPGAMQRSSQPAELEEAAQMMQFRVVPDAAKQGTSSASSQLGEVQAGSTLAASSSTAGRRNHGRHPPAAASASPARRSGANMFSRGAASPSSGSGMGRKTPPEATEPAFRALEGLQPSIHETMSLNSGVCMAADGRSKVAAPPAPVAGATMSRKEYLARMNGQAAADPRRARSDQSSSSRASPSPTPEVSPAPSGAHRSSPPPADGKVAAAQQPVAAAGARLPAPIAEATQLSPPAPYQAALQHDIRPKGYGTMNASSMAAAVSSSMSRKQLAMIGTVTVPRQDMSYGSEALESTSLGPLGGGLRRSASKRGSRLREGGGTIVADRDLLARLMQTAA
eukprot:TRINITY_DN21708_c0_g1_i1.p1 TRINITY_DN21708_c0_g1~~TRINITY_DN21708_c0_g1_i1.p1  ORF type:complete len:436 (-),score=95.55 TRINITY_DN21708_c0_g1_i1:194-1501(-)